ncbi:MAG: polyphosphate--nucleotide phosphotransferase [Elusimicrobia bacterium]|nr:polyphosphate--nucleotide phosphotransferase [Elusimicrobiota bacterium]
MIAFLLALCLGGAAAVEYKTPVEGARGAPTVVSRVPKLELPGAGISIPDATGDSTPLGLVPVLPEPLASIPDATGDSRPLSPEAAKPSPFEQDDQALPVLEALSDEIKPGATFTEKEFSRRFDGLGKFRAPAAEERVDLSEIDPSDTGKIDSKKKALKKLARDQKRIDKSQQILLADPRRKILVVLQGMDTAGKDGVIRHVMRGLNPKGVQVTSFKKPTDEEKKHHYLWRIAKALPGKGMIGIFNRSQYEDILVPSVHPERYPELTPEDIDKRYDAISAFEKEMAQKGWTILKFYLHIDKEEQQQRLQERVDNPAKNYKFSPEDLESRKDWPKYIEAYEKILARTNTPWAPWYVIPSNDKRYRDYLVAKILKKTLKRLKLKYPPPNPKLKKIKIPD